MAIMSVNKMCYEHLCWSINTVKLKQISSHHFRPVTLNVCNNRLSPQDGGVCLLSRSDERVRPAQMDVSANRRTSLD